MRIDIDLYARYVKLEENYDTYFYYEFYIISLYLITVKGKAKRVCFSS